MEFDQKAIENITTRIVDRAIIFAVENDDSLSETDKEILMVAVRDGVHSTAKQYMKKNPGQNVQCVKELREKFGIGLHEAKKVVDLYK